MERTHFVDHRHGAPLCGSVDESEWIETLRPELVTCEECAARLAGARRDDRGEPSCWTPEAAAPGA